MRSWKNKRIAVLLGLSILVVAFVFPLSSFADEAADEAACAAEGRRWIQGSTNPRTDIYTPGECLPAADGQCAAGYHYNINLGRCIQNELDDCEPPLVFNGTSCVAPHDAPAATAGYTAGTADAKSDFSCNPFDGKDFLPNCSAAILNLILSFAGLFVGLAGVFLNSVIGATIVDFSKFIGDNAGEQGAITLAWSLIRDVLNMTFIFILLYLGIKTILGDNSYPKIIPKIVIAGLLINFSFFFTEVMIDLSNVLTVQFYDAILKIGEAARGVSGIPTLDGLSGAFMNGLKLRPPKVLVGVDTVNMIFQLIPSIIAFLVAAFVFLVMGVMLLVRFIVLIILLITSPIMVMGDILPQLSKQSKQWRDTLAEQLIFAPAFMLFMLVVVLIINSAGFRKGVTLANVPGNATAVNGILAFLLPYALAIGLMIAGLVISKQLAGSSGKGFTDWASKKAGSATFGVAAWSARQGLGRAGSALQQSSLVGKGLKSNFMPFKYAAKAASLTGKRATEATFDLRGTALGGALPGVGKGRTGGLVGDRKARSERRVERAKVYAESIAIQNKRAEIAAKRNALSEAEANLAAGSRLGGLPEQIEARRVEHEAAIEKARRDLATSENTLREMQGGFGANEARKKLQQATESLSAQQLEEAKASAQIVEAQEQRLKKLRDAAKFDPTPQKNRAVTEAQRQLDAFKERQGATIVAYIDAQKAVGAAQKAAKDAVETAKATYGAHLVGSRFESTRMAADELRKQSKKSDQAILDELKKVMETVEQAPGTPPTGGTPPGETPTTTQQAGGNDANPPLPRTM